MLEELPGLGPKSAEMLVKSGIDNIAQLRMMGAVKAYALVKQSQPRASLNLLWALEAALTGDDWRVVARERRTDLLLALDDLAKNRVG